MKFHRKYFAETANKTAKGLEFIIVRIIGNFQLLYIGCHVCQTAD